MSSADPSIHRHEVPLAPAVPLHSHGDGRDPHLEARVLALVSEFFPGPVEIEEIFDPSEPERKWHMIVVSAAGTTEELLAVESLWRRRYVQEFTPDELWRYTLAVVPESK
jgi:hypothetical protein